MSSEAEELLGEARRRFDRRPAQVETGLDVDDAELLQLRKACRLLETAGHLRDENGYYTVVIEVSFAAIERTFQFYLLENGLLRPDEYVDHGTVYERAHEAGLYDDEFREKLVSLWRNNRSRSYYREEVGSRKRAETMLELAREVHRHVLHLANRSHDCICR